MTAKTEALAEANAQLNNAGLPTYDDLCHLVAQLLEDARHLNGRCPNSGTQTRIEEATAALAKITA